MKSSTSLGWALFVYCSVMGILSVFFPVPRIFGVLIGLPFVLVGVAEITSKDPILPISIGFAKAIMRMSWLILMSYILHSLYTIGDFKVLPAVVPAMHTVAFIHMTLCREHARKKEATSSVA